MEIPVLMAAGAIVGMLAGLLGIGGGALIVPVLVFFFERQGIGPDAVMQAAIGTSLATIIFTSLSSIRSHHVRGAIRWPVFRQITPGIVLGVIGGAAIAHWLPGETLRILFVIFALSIAAQMIRGRAGADKPPRPLPVYRWMACAGVVIGAVSSLFGIAGASLCVPFLTWFGVPAVQAVATASAIGFPVAVVGTASYIVTGWKVAGLPPWSVGYIVLPPLVGIVIASTLCAPLGVRLAHRLSRKALERIFAGFLIAMALRLALS